MRLRAASACCPFACPSGRFARTARSVQLSDPRHPGRRRDFNGKTTIRRSPMRRVLAAVLVALYAATAVGLEVVTRIIPVVGSTPGNHGSFFRTELQFRNGGGADLSGRFVFHP